MIAPTARLSIDERARALDVCNRPVRRAHDADPVNPKFRQALIVSHIDRDRATGIASLWATVADHYHWRSDFLQDLDVLLVACVIERANALGKPICFRITEHWATHVTLSGWDPDLDEYSEVWLAAATALRAGYEDAARDIVEAARGKL